MIKVNTLTDNNGYQIVEIYSDKFYHRKILKTRWFLIKILILLFQFLLISFISKVKVLFMKERFYKIIYLILVTTYFITLLLL